MLLMLLHAADYAADMIRYAIADAADALMLSFAADAIPCRARSCLLLPRAALLSLPSVATPLIPPRHADADDTAVAPPPPLHYALFAAIAATPMR